MEIRCRPQDLSAWEAKWLGKWHVYWAVVITWVGPRCLIEYTSSILYWYVGLRSRGSMWLLVL